MMQFDVFWAYAFGAGFSMAAFRQLKTKSEEVKALPVKKPRKKSNHLFENKYFISSLLYITVIFAPGIMYLLWAFPSWETMHVGNYETIPAWIVALFLITLPLSLILGFWVTSKLFMAEKYYAGALQIFIGYFLMFFMLVNGWDKTGYQRFFSATKEDFLNWPTGFSEKINVVKTWLSSDVATAFFGMGIILIPAILMMLKWLYEGYDTKYLLDSAKRKKINPIMTAIILLTAILGGCLGFAITATILIAHTGWILGLLIFSLIAYFLGFRIFFPFICRWIILIDIK